LHYSGWSELKLAIDALNANKRNNQRLRTTAKLKDFGFEITEE